MGALGAGYVSKESDGLNVWLYPFNTFVTFQPYKQRMDRRSFLKANSIVSPAESTARYR